MVLTRLATSQLQIPVNIDNRIDRTGCFHYHTHLPWGVDVIPAELVSQGLHRLAP